MQQTKDTRQLTWLLAWAVVFLFCYEAVVLFVDVREALRIASHLFQAASGAASGVTPPP